MTRNRYNDNYCSSCPCRNCEDAREKAKWEERMKHRKRPSDFTSEDGPLPPVDLLEHGQTPNKDGFAFALQPAIPGAHKND